ncbi:flagellin lysine-N-methylase [Eubacterium sp.]|uniref:flagellin lysine-N-methylase n=1 Tax=Eubacterium sp. TaxID=142586 RepID=UPI0025C3E3C2|nr:flagellin lysine-N-methylase [Eubacterium sp.]MCI7800314.1 flagellin lysine-N-methylase [Eubacterium sp.]
MKIVKPTFYKNFKCIAGDCPDSCCQGWEVDADSDSLEYYKTLDNSLEIKKRIDSVLSKDEFDNTIFTLAPKKRCPFLNDENLCDMHIAIGGEHTPYTCRTFPRFIYDFGGTREIGISFSCPVASDMMYNTESFDFETEVNSDLPTLNDIDAEKYFLLYKGRAEAYKIAKDKNKSIRERLNDLLDLGVLLQEKLLPYDEGGDDIAFFDVFKNPELINPEWKEKVENFSLKQVSDTQSNENILMYFLYKYLMQAVYDYDALSKIKMAVLGVLINTYFGEDSWTVHLWSKETEHSQYNMDRYKKLLKSADCLSVNELKNRI